MFLCIWICISMCVKIEYTYIYIHICIYIYIHIYIYIYTDICIHVTTRQTIGIASWQERGELLHCHVGLAPGDATCHATLPRKNRAAFFRQDYRNPRRVRPATQCVVNASVSADNIHSFSSTSPLFPTDAQNNATTLIHLDGDCQMLPRPESSVEPYFCITTSHWSHFGPSHSLQSPKPS